MSTKYIGNCRIHCYKCGRFVGKDGIIDVSYDYYNGGYEEGYSLCKRCLDKQKIYGWLEMPKLFNDEEHLKRYIKKVKNKQRSCEYYVKINRNQLLQLNNELCFIFDNYNELY